MRIGYVVRGGVDRTGARRVVPHLVERLGALAAAHDVRVIALEQEPRPGCWTLAGAEVHNVGRRPRRARALALLLRLHRERPFDVLHAFGLVPQGAVVAAAVRILGLPAVMEAPGGEFANLPDIDYGGWRRWSGRASIRWAASNGTVVVPTEAARTLAAERGVGARVVPLELDTRAWPLRHPRVDIGPLRIAWVGSLNRVKDPFALVEVAANLGESRRALYRRDRILYDVVGEDFLDGAVQRAVADRGLADRVRFHGWLSQGALRELLDQAHLLLVTSRHEGAGRVVLEAAARGVPTLGFAVGHVADWARVSAVGIPASAMAVPLSAGVAELTRALGELLDDGPRWLTMGNTARERLPRHFVGLVAVEWGELYREIVEAAAAGESSRE